MKKRLVIIIDNDLVVSDLVSRALPVALEIHVLNDLPDEEGVTIGPAPKRLPAKLKLKPQAQLPPPVRAKPTRINPQVSNECRKAAAAYAAMGPFTLKAMGDYLASIGFKGDKQAQRALSDLHQMGKVERYGGNQKQGYIYRFTPKAPAEPAHKPGEAA